MRCQLALLNDMLTQGSRLSLTTACTAPLWVKRRWLLHLKASFEVGQLVGHLRRWDFLDLLLKDGLRIKSDR